MTFWWFKDHSASKDGSCNDPSDNDFDGPFNDHLIGLWDFNARAEGLDTGLADGFAQNGTFYCGASAVNGALKTDGNNDKFIVGGNDDPFDLATGTITAEFTQDCHVGTSPDTIVSRGEYADRGTEGYFTIEVTKYGAVQLMHCANGADVQLSTGNGFFASGDDVRVAYSWDENGTGHFVVENVTKGTMHEVAFDSTGLTLDIGDNDGESFVMGAREVDDGSHDRYFDGQINYVAVYDKDIIGPQLDGIVEGTDGDDVIDLAYTGDPDGDMIDAGDAILPGEAPNDDIVQAGAGNDTVYAGLGDDEVYGGTGNDTIFGEDGSDYVDGGDGDDTIDTSGPDALPDRGYPGIFDADADPLNDRDTVFGGAGNDTIITGDDNDYIDGGIGNDTIDAGYDDDTVFGGAGNDTIIGGEGSDTIDGGAGTDTIYGGLGPDLPDALNIPDATDLRPDNGKDLIHGGDGDDVIFGQDDDDTIYGDAGNDTIDGGIDDDFIDGGTGDDTITGGQGADTLLGGDDRDTFIGGNVGDVVDGGEGGADFDILDLSGSGPLKVIYDPSDAEKGTVEFRDNDGNLTGTMSFSNIENVIPCFTPGSTIATPKGERLVEDLRVGDRVLTRDNGIQEIRWVGAKELDWKALAVNPHLRPVLIRKGALGNELPERDMWVSPNHRMLVASERTQLYFEEREVLAAAKHLINNHGVAQVEVMQTTYIHFMFDRHEVVLSNGSWTESFQPGDYTLQGIGNAQRTEILELFPELATQEGQKGYVSARRTLKKHEASLVVPR